MRSGHVVASRPPFSDAEQWHRIHVARHEVRSGAVESTNDVQVRLATEDDTDQILDVCGAALGWSDPEFDRRLFSWKHFDNTFGRSMILVAEGESGLLAVRPFMRWRFREADTTIEAARAVDTATLPAAQGRGLFTALTTAGLEELEEQGVGFVFNTPNDKSLPGYVKMGWIESGQIPFGFGLRAPARLPRIVRSRTAAEKRSIVTNELGLGVAEGLSSIHFEATDAGTSTSSGRRTAHGLDSLLWRYAAGPITYRWVPTGESTGCVVRLRRRGKSRELVVAHTIGDRTSPEARAAIRQAMRTVDADYCLAAAGFSGTFKSSRIGPILALRKVSVVPQPGGFDWEPGDVELF